MPNGAKSSTGIDDFFFFESHGGETTMAGSRSVLAWFDGCVSCCWHDFSTAAAGVESQGMTCSASAASAACGTQRRLSSFDRDSV